MLIPPPIQFFVPVTPEATGNAHYVQRSGAPCSRCKKKPKASIGRKPWAKRLKRTIQIHAASHRPREPWPGPVRASFVFELPMPKSFGVWQREAALLGYLTPIGARDGDRDNLLKVVADALESGFFLNDSQIDRGPLRKIYAEIPGYRIQLEFLPLPPASAAEWKAIKAGLSGQEETCDAIDPIAAPEDAFL